MWRPNSAELLPAKSCCYLGFLQQRKKAPYILAGQSDSEKSLQNVKVSIERKVPRAATEK